MPRTDGTSGNARRKQKVYQDILGRTFKTETYNWNGTVYSTSLALFNERDQVLRSRQYEGDTSSTTFQDTTATFDGHGRMASSHRPEQRDSSNNLKYTTYNYNADDSISSVVDARGATTHYQYNSRALLEEVSWSVPAGSNITVPSTISYQFDNAGNVTHVGNGSLATSYVYNELSQLISETRTFSDSLPNAPLPNNSYQIEYGFDLAGQLKWIEDPFGQRINYQRDEIGRLAGIHGSSSFDGVTAYITNMIHRAWGAPKEVSYGNGLKNETTFDLKLLPASTSLTKPATSAILMRKEYTYYDDGGLGYMSDPDTPNFDRSYSYDSKRKLVQARTGPEARGETASDPTQIPFREDFEHSPFGQLSSIAGDLKPGTSCELPGFENTNTFVNNRNTGMGWNYDADGRPLHGRGLHKVYDARGQRITEWDGSSNFHLSFEFDASGREIKRTEAIFDWTEMDWEDPKSKFYIRSTLLGGSVLTEVAEDGKKKVTYVMAGNEVVAEQRIDLDGNSAESVVWEHWDASRNTRVQADKDGNPVYKPYYYPKLELDPLGNNVNYTCLPPSGDRGYSTLWFERNVFSTARNYDWGYGEYCFWDGVPSFCETVDQILNSSGEAIGEVLYIDDPLPVFSDLAYRTWIGSIEEMAYDLRFEGYEDSVLLDQHLGSTDDSSVTVTAGAPMYRFVQPHAFENNGERQTKLTQEDCDRKIAAIFGGAGAVAATAIEPTTLPHPTAGKDRSAHLADNGTFHIYTNEKGSDAIVGLYAPAGWLGTTGNKNVYFGKNDVGVEGELNYNYIRFNYKGGLSISFLHVGNPGTNVQDKNSAGSIRIGNIGGPDTGGEGAGYQHTHVNVYVNGRRTDPRKAFCGWK